LRTLVFCRAKGAFAGAIFVPLKRGDSGTKLSYT
jgi:hypothetical protein